MANVLLLNGSPHAHGAIDLALTKVAQTLQECGLTTEIVHIGQQDIRGCIACGRCGVLHRCRKRPCPEVRGGGCADCRLARLLRQRERHADESA